MVYERLMQQPIKASAENGNLISQCNSETFTPDLPWWKKYIKQREKQYNRK